MTQSAFIKKFAMAGSSEELILGKPYSPKEIMDIASLLVNEDRPMKLHDYRIYEARGTVFDGLGLRVYQSVHIKKRKN
jgi:hypothetical protein